MLDQTMLERIRTGQGFIAALDQSGGSTPKALKGYGVAESAWGDAEGMFGLLHALRSRIVLAPARKCSARSCSSARWTGTSTARPRRKR